MGPITTALIAELDREARSTRRVLERIPDDGLAWRPHERSMSAGQLARHIAAIPGALADFFSSPVREVPTVPLPEPNSVQDILAEHEASVAKARRTLESWDDAWLHEPFAMTAGGAVIYQAPRLEGVRSIMFNHLYHHRGQLVVYLRMLEVAVPGVYGPSADESGRGSNSRTQPAAVD